MQIPNLGGTKVPGDDPLGIGGTGTKDPGTSQYSLPWATTPFALLDPDHEPRKERSILTSETFRMYTLTAANYPLDIGGGKSSDGGVSQMGMVTNFNATIAGCSTRRYPDRNFGVYSSPHEPLGTFY